MPEAVREVRDAALRGRVLDDAVLMTGGIVHDWETDVKIMVRKS